MIQTFVPFDLVFDEGLSDLGKYKVLILPDTECLSDEQFVLIHRFVDQVVTGQAGIAGSASRKHVGRGRVAYLPMVEFDGPLLPSRPNFAIISEFWKMPRNAKQLIDLMRWAAEGRIPLSIEEPDGLVANYTAQISRRRMFVHLVNYNSAKIPKLQDIRVRVSLPGATKALS